MKLRDKIIISVGLVILFLGLLLAFIFMPKQDKIVNVRYDNVSYTVDKDTGYLNVYYEENFVILNNENSNFVMAQKESALIRNTLYVYPSKRIKYLLVVYY